MGFAAFLNHTFEQRRMRNRRYSLRAFARNLGVDHASLSQWMRGTRPLSDEAIDRLADALCLSAVQRAHSREFDPLDVALVEAAATDAPPTTPELARRLGATADHVNVCLARLLRLGLLTMNGAAWITRTEG